MDDKTLYEVNSIFQQPWWLDAVAPGQWGAAVVNRGEEVAAHLPYVLGKRYGMKAIIMPELTQTAGPWLRKSTAKYANQISEQKELMGELIAQLPEVDYFCQSFSPSITNWLPFYWHGFQQTTRYTYRIEDLSDTEKIWASFAKNARNNIRKAEKLVTVRSDLELDKFLRVNSLTFLRQNMEIPVSDDFIRRLDNACLAHDARKMFFAEDAQGRIHAGIYLVWDSNTAYLIMSGEDPELRNSEACSLLVWEAIKFASTVTRVFDFEGSMIESIERFFRSFGATQTPYFQLTKLSRKMRIAEHGRELIKALLNR